MAKDLGMCLLIDTYSAVLTEKQRSVLQMYYFDDLSLAEIGELEGISRQGVRDSIKRGEDTILTLESQLHFAHKFDNLEKYSRRIKKDAGDILAYADSRGYAEQIKRAAMDINAVADGIDKFIQEDE